MSKKRHIHPVIQKQLSKSDPNIALLPHPAGGGVIVPDDIATRAMLDTAYAQGWAERGQVDKKIAAFNRWWAEAELRVAVVFTKARYMKFLAVEARITEFDGETDRVTGAWNEMVAAGESIGVDIPNNFPELYARLEAINEGIKAVKNQTDPHAERLEALAKISPGFGISIDEVLRNAGVDPGGRKRDQVLDRIGKALAEVKSSHTTWRDRVNAAKELLAGRNDDEALNRLIKEIENDLDNPGSLRKFAKRSYER